VRSKPLDFTADKGLWTPCAGSVTPWETHLGSEEYEPDAKCFYDNTCSWDSWPMNKVRPFLRFFGTYTGSAGFNKDIALNAGFRPYRYGYPWETVVHADFTETTTKLYAHGRQSYEMSYAMPDRKTVYNTDDGTNVFFAKFVADKEGDITEGQNFCAKYTQTSPTDCEAIDWTADIEWIAMPKATHSEIEAAIESTKFADLFNVAECAEYQSGSTCATGQSATNGVCCPSGYTAVNGGGRGCECLQVKPGQDKLAAHLEKRRYAGG
jgi:secreted PhoX family phosphatase